MKRAERGQKEAARSDPDRLSATWGNIYGTPAARIAKIVT